MSRALLLAGGPPPPVDFVRDRHRAGDLVICADRGLLLARAAGLTPTVLVGDLDSLPPGTELPAEVHRYPLAKDQSDLEIALEEAARRGATHAEILGALDGRPDHALFNLLALPQRAADLNLQAVLVAPGVEVQHLATGSHTLHHKLGWTLSLLPVDREAVLSLDGMAFPLQAQVLRRASTRGLSNLVLTDPATVEVLQGAVIAVLLEP